MLNKILKTAYLYSIVLICSASVQNDEITVLNLADALDLAHKNLPDSISPDYDYNIKSAYYNWIYSHNRFKILNEKNAFYKDYIVISDLHFKSGEINLTGKTQAETEYLKFKSQYSGAEYDLLISEINLKKLLYVSNDIKPENDSLVKYYLPDSIWGEPIQDSINVNYRYFAAKYDYLSLILLLKKYDMQLVYYEEVFSLAQQLISKTRFRYKTEDIEYFPYINIISNAIDLKLEYLQILNLYNQTAIKIEMYNK